MMRRREFITLLGGTAIFTRTGLISAVLIHVSLAVSANEEAARVILQDRNGTGMIVAQQEGPEALPSCGWIGVQVRPITAPFAASLGMVAPYGAIFDRPEAGSPAAEAGIEAGDVITAINGAPLMRASDFITLIARQAPGSSVSLSTWRNGMFVRVTLTAGSSKCREKRQDASTGEVSSKN